MIKSKVFIFNFLLFFTYVYAKDLGNIQDVGDSVMLFQKAAPQANTQKDSEANDGENLLLVILNPAEKSIGLQESAGNKNDCIGGILGFIQCVLIRKIESFSMELSKLSIPNKPPEGFPLQTIDSKIEGSLDDWFQKISEHVDSPEEDCNDD